MLYDIYKSYQENVTRGPSFKGKIPERKWLPKEKWIDFLGFRVASPLGVPAGPLLTSKWTTLAAQLGFDVVTYKTIRSHAYAGWDLPNVIYVKSEGPLKEGEGCVVKTDHTPQLSEMAITNSFGMPSQSPEFLERDIALANEQLKEGQLLVVSVVGSTNSGRDFLKDYLDTALLAKRSGAKVVEANFSCPNVKSKEGSLYNHPEAVLEMCTALVKALKETPLIIKVGVFANPDLMKKVLTMMARAGVQAVSGINTISKRVVDQEGKPALGPDRLTSGICGAPIQNQALEFVKGASRIIQDEKLPLTLIGVGGVTKAADFGQFLDAGAQFVQTATGMMWNPYLAHDFHHSIH